MASQWTSKTAILQDLSVAQGREVPVEISNALTRNEKPPIYAEETEEEFYADFVGGDDLETGPDLQLIKQMLDMVREVNTTDIDNTEVNNSTTSLEISKINTPLSSQRKEDEEPLKLPNNIKKVVQKQKKNRNVALASLIETHGDKEYINESNSKQLQSPNLLKPDDFVYNIKNSCKSNKDFLISSMIPTIKSPTSMFRKKSLITKPLEETSMNQRKCSTIINNETRNYNEPECFVPSSHADELYKAYLEKNKCLEQVEDDEWAKAERKMKEIDAKKKNEGFKENAPSLTSSENLKSSKITGMDFVRLPQHRHLLTGDCTVCEVLCTHRTAVEKTSTL